GVDLLLHRGHDHTDDQVEDDEGADHDVADEEDPGVGRVLDHRVGDVRPVLRGQQHEQGVEGGPQVPEVVGGDLPEQLLAHDRGGVHDDEQQRYDGAQPGNGPEQRVDDVPQAGDHADQAQQTQHPHQAQHREAPGQRDQGDPHHDQVEPVPDVPEERGPTREDLERQLGDE